MKLLAGTHYDPAAAVSKATSSLLAMTALDTTNLRLTFTVPSNGSVLIRTRHTWTGATTMPQLLFGALDHTNADAVKVRQAPLYGKVPSNAAAAQMGTCSIIVTGLTPGASLTYDAAYGVEVVIASTNIKYGGPNNTTGNDAWGGFSYEIWDTPGLLGAAHYDPSSAAVSSSVAVAAAMTALDTTNLRLTFTAPSSGNVYVRLRGVVSGTTTATLTNYWGVLDGATVRFRSRGIGGQNGASGTAATDQLVTEASGLVTGLTPGTSYTWDAAFAAEGTAGGAVIKYGGPDNTTTDDAWGGFAFDVWNVDSLPRAIGSVT